MKFSSFDLPESLVKALSDNGISDPYPIQQEVIPAVLKGRDILGIAQTGSGKTLSFVLPILVKLQKISKSQNRHVAVLVMVPTRELAVQVQEVFQLYNNLLEHRIKTLAVYGGVSINPQMIALQNVKVLIATPGRLLELVESKAVSLSEVKILVLDEADKILNLGFKDEMDKVFDMLPSKKQNLLFSATLSPEIEDINKVLLEKPLVIKIEKDQGKTNLINHVAYKVTEEKKGPLLRYLIKSRNLTQVLVFVSSTYKADNVVDKLKKNGLEAMAIHSKKSQGARTEALSLFKSGKLNVLVATDLLARGIDIEYLPCVINYELPRSPKEYIHRIGRTGRAESTGDAIAFVTADELTHFKVILKKMDAWIDLIDSEEINLHGF